MGGRLVGDVVLARFPFADRSDDKLRPVLVVADVTSPVNVTRSSVR